MSSVFRRCASRPSTVRLLAVYGGVRLQSTAAMPTMDRSIYVLDSIQPDEAKFDKILIANRGEIACRVMHTCKAMGIQTVAVHSDVDSNALHVKLADEAICVGAAPTSQSYLRMDRILQAVADTGAQAVHPGYGFLSENTVFAAELTQAGGTFIGPNSDAIKAMGDKIESKRIATAANVNMIPGYDGEVEDAEHCVRVSNEIGYPVMMKASAGGGGKGMRTAYNDKEAREGFRLCQEEAAASFGDDRMLVEKYVEKPRHIEVQVLADKHGNAIYLNERECSIQRRNQKVIEEAPSPFVDGDMRAAMGEQAVAMARAVGYDSAGTVEFLVDKHKNFYFLEMNTRLQVEHPITEEITGVDLVQQMIRVAYGHKLNLKQSDIGVRGHAVECRVYAEDPTKGFGLPSVGRLWRYQEPTYLPGVRCDSGIREGSDISIYYDPLICKLVTYGRSRSKTLNRMRDALDHYVIRGVLHNIPMLRDIMEEKQYRKGDITTAYLYETYPDGFMGARLSDKEEDQLTAITGAIQAFKQARSTKILNQGTWETFQDPYEREYQYGVGVPRIDGTQTTKKLRVKFDDHRNATVGGDSTVHTCVWVDGHQFDVTGKLSLSKPVLEFEVTDNTGTSHITTQVMGRESISLTLLYKGTPFKMHIMSQRAKDLYRWMPVKKEVDTSRVTLAPMPGLIKSVSVVEGQEVTEGQELCVIEAMKMQNSLQAGKSGKVKKVNVKENATVDEGEVLVELE